MDTSGSYRKIRTGTKQYYVCSKCNFSSESEYNVSSHFRLSHIELITQSKNTLYRSVLFSKIHYINKYHLTKNVNLYRIIRKPNSLVS